MPYPIPFFSQRDKYYRAKFKLKHMKPNEDNFQKLSLVTLTTLSINISLYILYMCIPSLWLTHPEAFFFFCFIYMCILHMYIHMYVCRCVCLFTSADFGLRRAKNIFGLSYTRTQAQMLVDAVGVWRLGLSNVAPFNWIGRPLCRPSASLRYLIRWCRSWHVASFIARIMRQLNCLSIW